MKKQKLVALGLILIFGGYTPRLSAQNGETSKTDSLPKPDYALIHIYRLPGFLGRGALAGYDLHLDNDRICRVKNKWKKTIRIKKEGAITIWAATEVRREVPLDIRLGHEYYIRCGISEGMFAAHPKLMLVENEIGKNEYASIKQNEYDRREIIVLKDGREIECKILREDNENVYFSIYKNDNEINTQVGKDKIKEIQRDN